MNTPGSSPLLSADVRSRLGPEVSQWIEGYAVSAPDVESGDTTPEEVAEDMVALFDRFAASVVARTKPAAPAEPLQHALDFWPAWLALPPLVRASAASGVVDMIERQRSSLHEGEKIDIAHGMTRRLAVTRRFVEAYAVLAALCAWLTREADEEAEARGIDADIAADPDPLEEQARAEGVPVEQIRAEFAVWKAAGKPEGFFEAWRAAAGKP